MTSLTSLIERIEKATGPDRELDLAIHDALFPRPAYKVRSDVKLPQGFGEDAFSRALDPRPHYTGSHDDALTLLPVGYEYDITTLYHLATVTLPLNGGEDSPPITVQRKDGDVILAFVECCLRSRSHEGERG